MANMRTYSVPLTRVDPEAERQANFRVDLKAQDDQTTKHNAAAQDPEYEATSGISRVAGT